MTNTKPLKEFLQDALEEEEKQTYLLKAVSWHREWLRKYGHETSYKLVRVCRVISLRVVWYHESGIM